MKKYILIFIIFLLFIFGQVFFIGNQVSLGELVYNAERMIDQVKLENTELEKEIAIKSSYKDISERAQTLDFTQASSVIEVKNNEVALKR